MCECQNKKLGDEKMDGEVKSDLCYTFKRAASHIEAKKNSKQSHKDKTDKQIKYREIK